MTDAAPSPADPAGTKVVGHVVMEVTDVEQALAETGAFAKRRLLLWPLLLAAWLSISALTNADSGVPWATIIPIALMVCFWVGVLIYARKRTARKILEGKSERDRTVTFELDAAGYSISTPTSSSKAEWSTLYRYHEGKTAFLFFLNPTVHQILPKRAFREEDIAKLRTLLRDHVTQRPAGRFRAGVMVFLWAFLIVVFLAVWQWFSMAK